MKRVKALRLQNLGLWLGLALSLFDQRVFAASISFVGVEPSTGPAYATQNWSWSSVAKTFDLGGTEIYGTAGYYQIRPTPNSSPSNVSEAVSAGNNLGITAGTNPTLYSAPVFLSLTNGIKGGAGTFVNFGGYPTFLGPDATTVYRQGSLSVSVGNGPFNTPSGDNTGYYGDAFSFTMATNMAADFRIGIAVDTAGTGLYAPDYVSIYNSGTGSVFSSLLTRNASSEMTFFDVTASAGESFSVAMWQLAGSNSVAPFGLITFDVSRYKFDVTNGLVTTNSVALSGSPAALVKTGDGTLVVTSSNTYGGGTLISAGTLKLQGGSVAGNITNNGNLTLSADLANPVSGTGSLTKIEAGNATLWNPNSYGGATVVEAGQLRLDGSGAISSNSVVQIASGAGFSATGVFKTSNDLTIAGLTGAGQFYNAAGNLTINKVTTNTSDVFTGSIDGGTGLIKSGAGTLVLAGSNSYTGSTSIDEGRLVLAHSNALGGTANGTVVANGAQLRINTSADTIFAAEPLTLSGDGLAGSVGGALRNATNNNTWKGKITLAGNASIGSASGTTLTLDVDSGDAVDLSGNTLTIDGAGSVLIKGITGTGGLTKDGSGTTTLVGTNSYNGTTTVSLGTLVVSNSILTATITPATISVTLSNSPSGGDTFQLIPGSLAGSYGTPDVTPLGADQTASFDASTGVLSITQGATGPSDLFYSATSVSGFVGTEIIALTTSVTGTVDSYSIDPALPFGLSIDPVTGTVSGTPTVVSSSQIYTITASGMGGSTTAQVTIEVGKGTPAVFWPTASSIVEGQSLSASTLSGGSATPSGSFAWENSSTVPSVGASAHTVTFTPEDADNYNEATYSVSVTVVSKVSDWLKDQPTNSANVGKYAIGGATNVSGPSELPTSSLDASKLSLKAIVRTNDTNLVIVGEAGTSLTNWSTNGISSIADGDQAGVISGCERRIFSIERTNGTNRLFLRLKATLGP